jgi:ligand-binding sensor domain-containing protein
MKKTTMIMMVLLIIGINSSGATVWKNYSSSTNATSLCKIGSVMWIGTTGGLVEYNTGTSAATLHTHATDALPGNKVNDIAADGSGGLWAATNNGVWHKKNDGSIVNYADTNLAFPSGSAEAICSDKSGGAWVLVYSEKIVHITGAATFVTYTKDSIPALKGAYVENCVIDNNGKVWVSLSDSGLICSGTDGWTRYTKSQISTLESADDVEKLFVDKNNNLWISDASGYLTKFNGTDFTSAGKTPNDEPIGAIAQSPLDDSIWVGLSYSGAGPVIEGQSWENYISFTSGEYPKINDMVFDSDGNLWIATDSGTVVLKNGAWIKISHNPTGLVANDIRCLAPDLINGGVWAGFYDGGAAYFKDGSFTVYMPANSQIPSSIIYSILVDGATTWFGTDNGLASLNGTTWTSYTKATKGLLADNVNSLLKCGDTLWVGHYGKGLEAIVNGTVAVQFTNSPTGLPDDDVTDLGKDSSGGLWVTTDGGGLAKYDGSSWSVFKSDNSGLINNDVRAIAVEASGTRWIGTTGLNRYSIAGTWKSWQVFIEPYYPAGLLCVDIAIDKNNTKWLAGAGLYAFDGTKYTGYKTENCGVSENNINCIAIDKSGNIWAGTGNSGIVVLENPPAVSVHDTKINTTMIKSLNSSGISQYDILGRLCTINKSGKGPIQKVSGFRIGKSPNGNTKIVNTR